MGGVRPRPISHRTATARQPRDGYVPLSWFRSRTFGPEVPFDGNRLKPSEVGTLVDYLTRYSDMREKGLSKQEADVAFESCMRGATNLERNLRYNKREFKDSPIACCKSELAKVTYPLNNLSVKAAARVTFFDAFVNTDVRHHTRKFSNFDLSDGETARIRRMVRNGIRMMGADGGIKTFDFVIPKDPHSTRITGGRGDYLTEKTLYDMKVSWSEPKVEWTLQILIYYLMGLSVGLDGFDKLKYIGIVNPRLNKTWRCSTATLRRNKNALRKVCESVIGYDAKYTREMLKGV